MTAFILIKFHQENSPKNTIAFVNKIISGEKQLFTTLQTETPDTKGHTYIKYIY